MPVIYESPRGRVHMGFLGGYSVETPRFPVKRTLPPWLKSRLTLLWEGLRGQGFDASRDADAACILFEYVIDCMDGGALAQAAAMEEMPSDVFSGMLAELRVLRKK